jgi:hypothetical protein
MDYEHLPFKCNGCQNMVICYKNHLKRVFPFYKEMEDGFHHVCKKKKTNKANHSRLEIKCN